MKIITYILKLFLLYLLFLRHLCYFVVTRLTNTLLRLSFYEEKQWSSYSFYSKQYISPHSKGAVRSQVQNCLLRGRAYMELHIKECQYLCILFVLENCIFNQVIFLHSDDEKKMLSLILTFNLLLTWWYSCIFILYPSIEFHLNSYLIVIIKWMYVYH